MLQNSIISNLVPYNDRTKERERETENVRSTVWIGGKKEAEKKDRKRRVINDTNDENEEEKEGEKKESQQMSFSLQQKKEGKEMKKGQSLLL